MVCLFVAQCQIIVCSGFGNKLFRQGFARKIVRINTPQKIGFALRNQ